MSRPFLMTYIPGATDYINAVFVDVSKPLVIFIVALLLHVCTPEVKCRDESKFLKWWLDKKHTVIKRVVIETTCVCDVVTTLRLLRFTLIKFAIHRSIFPKRSGRIHRCLYRHQKSTFGINGLLHDEEQVPAVILNCIFAIIIRFRFITINNQIFFEKKNVSYT